MIRLQFRKKRWLWILLIPGLMAAYGTIQRSQGKRHLQKHLEELNRLGERVNVRELEPARCTDSSRNIVPGVQALAPQLDEMKAVLESRPRAPEGSTPGTSVLLHRLPRWKDSQTGETNQWESFLKRFKEHDALLRQVRAALERPEFDLGADYHGNFQLPSPTLLLEIKQAATALATQILVELHEGNGKQAHQDLQTLIRFHTVQASERFVISQLVRQATYTFVISLIWEGLQADIWTDLELHVLAELLSPLDFSRDMRQAIAMERAMNLEHFQNDSPLIESLLENSWQNWEESTDHSLAGQTLQLLRPMQRPFWRWSWRHEDFACILEKMQTLLDTHDSAVRQGWAQRHGYTPRWAPQTPVLTEISIPAWMRFRYPLASQTHALTDLLTRRSLDHQTQTHLARTALACHRFRIQNGSWPKQLSDLAGYGLGGLLSDPMGGGSLIYRSQNAASFLLYSKGRDGEDNGGDPSPSEAGTSQSFGSASGTRDLVWPRVTR